MWRQGEPRPAVPFTEVPSNLNQFSATQLAPDAEYRVALKARSIAGWGAERVLRVRTDGTPNGMYGYSIGTCSTFTVFTVPVALFDIGFHANDAATYDKYQKFAIVVQ